MMVEISYYTVCANRSYPSHSLHTMCDTRFLSQSCQQRGTRAATN